MTCYKFNSLLNLRLFDRYINLMAISLNSIKKKREIIIKELSMVNFVLKNPQKRKKNEVFKKK